MTESKTVTSNDKWRYTLYTTLVFVLVSIPCTYQTTNKLLGGLFGSLANSVGCPTTLGLGLHAVVFTLVVRYMMDMDL